MTGIIPTQNLIYTPPSSSNVSGSASASASTEPGNNASAQSVLTTNISEKVVGATALYNASLELAGLNSRLQVAQAGTQQVANILQNLQSIAQQIANGSGNTSSLVAEFQSLYSQIQQIISSASFGGSKLLDGGTNLNGKTFDVSSLTGQDNSTPDLSVGSLFGNAVPDVTTQQSAYDSLASIANAQNFVNTAANGFEQKIAQVNFIIATLDTAQANNFASGSSLNEGDFAAIQLQGFANDLLKKPDYSANAQTGNLSDSVLKLLSE